VGSAHPTETTTKTFFVDMLTRDIELEDAILDLLDNCIDGIQRTIKGRELTDRPYEGFEAKISFSESGFKIEDNCGGIPLEVARIKSDIFDIIKITLNANLAEYQAAEVSHSDEIQVKRIDKLKEILGEEDLFPSADISPKMMIHKEFPYVLNMVLKYAANLALKGKKDIYFQPLTFFSYQDGQQMMTLTGIILDNEEVEIFLIKLAA
jgi:hypothetical protein